MKNHYIPVFMLLAAPAFADTFGSGAHQFDIDFVAIGDADNAADSTGYGSVGYTYRMGMYEVSEAMIMSYNTLSGEPTITQDIRGADKPATSVSWNEAARFVNWLNTSSGFSAAYKFTTSGANDNIALWQPGDSGYDASNRFRNSDARYFLPSEDEWYKAAYYDPNANGGAGGYWDFATGSDTEPTAVAGGTTFGTAVYSQSFSNGPADIYDAGGLSPYGTMAQNGNVHEMSESAVVGPNDSVDESRLIRGGTWVDAMVWLRSTVRLNNSVTAESETVGFRVAAVPEPSTFVLGVVGMMGFVIRRKR